VLVQGEDAPLQIIKAIDYLNRERWAQLIIVGRGGGSVEDLCAFNNEGLARAIAASAIPIISAVGHETDVTIADFVADVRAPTPSAAAELAVPDRSALKQQFRNVNARLTALISGSIVMKRREVATLAERRSFSSPIRFVDDCRIRVDQLCARAEKAMIDGLRLNGNRLRGFVSTLDALSPLSVLARGYSIAYKGADVVRSVNDLATGDCIHVRFAQGSTTALVQELHDNAT